MKMEYKKYLGLFIVVVSTVSCVFKFDVESPKTVLEQQVLGDFKTLDDELVLRSSVRGDSKGQSVGGSVVYAKKNRKFNLDDIEEFKNLQFLGESNTGQLTWLPDGLGNTSRATKFQKNLSLVLIKEENRDREVIWQDNLIKNKNITKNNLPAIRKSFNRSFVDKTTVGQWYQDENAKWHRKVKQE